jgi:hypothetical protein
MPVSISFVLITCNPDRHYDDRLPVHVGLAARKTMICEIIFAFGASSVAATCDSLSGIKRKGPSHELDDIS